MTRLLVAGAGISGLACSLVIAKAAPSIELVIVDVRAEPGVPTNRPGLLGSRLEVIESLMQLGVEDSPTTPLMIGEGALRREWLVKTLAIVAARSGNTISPRTRLTKMEPTDIGVLARLEGAGPITDGDYFFDLAIDAMGNDPDPIEGKPPPRSEMSAQNIIQTANPPPSKFHWQGAVTSSSAPPPTPSDIVNPVTMGARSDDTVEWWVQGDTLQTHSALEKMGCMGGDEPPTIATSLSHGSALAEATLLHLSRAAKP